MHFVVPGKVAIQGHSKPSISHFKAYVTNNNQQ